MGDEVLDVGLEVVDDCAVCVELLDLGVKVGIAVGSADVEATPPQKDKLATVVVVVVIDQGRKDPKAVLASLIDSPIDGIERSIVEDTQRRLQR